jgi:hypothetical protein
MIGALVLWAVLAAPSAFADEEAAAEDGGTFRVEKAEIDIGKLKAGEEGVFVFTFHNESERDVKILRAKPT